MLSYRLVLKQNSQGIFLKINKQKNQKSTPPQALVRRCTWFNFRILKPLVSHPEPLSGFRCLENSPENCEQEFMHPNLHIILVCSRSPQSLSPMPQMSAGPRWRTPCCSGNTYGTLLSVRPTSSPARKGTEV